MICLKAQPTVSQEISPSQINKDEYATLKIIVENGNNIQYINPPSLKNFIVLSGPNQETGKVSVNGYVKRYSAIVFILKPKRPGKIRIDAATVTIAGKDYKTNGTELLVKNTASSVGSGGNFLGTPFSSVDPFEAHRPSADFTDYILRRGENVGDKVNKNILLRLETDKSSCFIGEPVVATYKLYTRLKSESKLTENPSFNGFSVIDLTSPDMSDYKRQKLNGREYNVYTIRKAQLYPLQAGNIELEAAELENNISFIKNEFVNEHRNDMLGMFDDFAMTSIPPEGIINQTVNLKSKPVTILVKPLPATNKPASFTGAVGDFSIEAALQKNNFPANETGKLVVRISGSGNLPLLTSPVLVWPEGIDPFDPKVSEELDKTAVPVSGNKIFEYGFTVNKTGNYFLPAIEFSYFDPVTAKYKTVNTKAISFTVTASTGPAVFASASPINKESVSGINKIFNNRWWIIEFIAIVITAGLIFWVRWDKRSKGKINKVEESAVDTAEKEKLDAIIETSAMNQQNPFEKTAVCLYQDNCIDFYTILNTELKTYLSGKFSVNLAEINTKNIAAVMDKKNISNETILQLQALLHEIEWQLYTPFERNEKLDQLYQKAQDIIQLINTYDFRHL